jgi:hypothetical protein
MKKFVVLLLLAFSIQSCVTNYYYVNVNADTPLYSSQNDGSTVICTVSSGSGMFIKGKKHKKYRKIKYGNYIGWAYNPNYTESNSSSSRSSSSSTSQSSPSSQSSSNYSTPSAGKTVQVKAYYRKDGTYVKSHTRSAPRRK